MEKDEFANLDKDTLIDLYVTTMIENEKLKEAFGDLQYENQEQKAELTSNKINSSSTTSSKPPSQDWSTKRPQSFKEVNKMVSEYLGDKPVEEPAHRGKQPNSKGYGKKLPENCEKTIIKCIPSECSNCPKKDLCNDHVTATRNVYDIKIVETLTTYKVCERSCTDKDGAVLSGQAPEGVNSSFQYGIMIKILTIILYFLGFSYNRIGMVFESLIGKNKPSDGTLFNIVKKFGTSDSLKKSYDSIFQTLKNKHGVLHADETGIRGNKKTFWLHTICDKLFSYCFISKFRGFKAMVEGGTALLAGNILVHDCWASYFKIQDIFHSLCNAHIIRNLAGIYIYYKQEWAIKLIVLLMEIYNKKKEAIEKGLKKFEDNIIQEYKNAVLQLVDEGINSNPLPDDQKDKKRPKRSNPLKVAMRIKDHVDQFLGFINNFDIPFSNNIAERTIRSAKIKIKNSGYLEEEGAKMYAQIYSVLHTSIKQEYLLSDVITKLILGQDIHFINYSQ